MLFKLDGKDFSESVDIAAYRLTPRRVYGDNSGYLLDGSHIPDLLAIKKDIQIRIVATEQRDTSSIASACMKETVQLEINDPISNMDINARYEPELQELEMAIEKDAFGNTYWYSFSIVFKEV